MYITYIIIIRNYLEESGSRQSKVIEKHNEQYKKFMPEYS